jgi:hypothetical protein
MSAGHAFFGWSWDRILYTAVEGGVRGPHVHEGLAGSVSCPHQGVHRRAGGVLVEIVVVVVVFTHRSTARLVRVVKIHVAREVVE